MSVADEVTTTLNELGATYSDDVTITVVSDLSTFIEESRDGLVKEGGLGALFAILTIFLFLFSIRSTIVAAVSIPLSILAALVVMQLTGITLNIMTLGGLAVAVGRVVDDAIVVLENIYRHRALGEDRLTASIEGPKEVAGAITAATITTVGVFLPLGFVGGLVSQFFLPFALTVTFALLASLVVALTVVPVLAYLLIDKVKINVDEDGEPKNSFWIKAYTPTIKGVLRNRWTEGGVVLAALVLFVVTSALAPLLPTAFINAGSEKILQVTVAPPPGTSTEAVLERTSEAEQILIADPEVVLVQSSIPGEGEAGFQTIAAAQGGRPANSARITVVLEDDVDLIEYSKVLSDSLAPVKTDGFDVAVSQAGGFTSNNLSVIVSGELAADVAKGNDAVMAALADNTDLLNLKSDLSKGTPEIQVTPDPNKAIALGLTSAQVAQEVRAALVGTTATRIVIGQSGDAVDVFVQADPSSLTSVEDLRQLPVGTVVKAPLETVATVEDVSAQGSITRIDESPAASISAEIASEDTGKVSQDVQAEIDALVAGRRHPAGRGCPARRRDPAAVRGLRRPVRLDGRGHPGRLCRHGAHVQLADHPVHHPVQPPARDHRRHHGAVRHGPPARRQRPHRLPDADRHRGHQRDRAARPGRAAAVAGDGNQGGAHRGRTDARPADPHDGDRHDPGPDPARCGVEPGFDHRRGAWHRRHRRPVQLNVPHPARHPGALLAGGRGKGPAEPEAIRRGTRGPDGSPRHRGRGGAGLILVTTVTGGHAPPVAP